MHAENVLEYVSKAAGLDERVVSLMLRSPGELSRLLGSLDANQPVRSDHYGLLSISSTSLKKRRAFFSCAPYPSDFRSLLPMFDCLDPLVNCHLRPLRITSTLLLLDYVERILRSETPNQSDPSEDTKLGFAFCGAVASSVLFLRSRDTCSVLRHAVCDYMLRWCEVNLEVLSSSVFNNRNGNIIDTLSHFIQDEDYDVRSLAIAGLKRIVDNPETPSRTAQKIIGQTCQVSLNSIISKCQELNELVETGNPPYIALVHSEIHSLAHFVRSMVTRIPSILDQFESAGKNNFDLIFQLIFDPLLPLNFRTCVAHIISSNVLGADIMSRSFQGIKRGIEMLVAFVYQYTPFEGLEKDYRSVFEAFFAELDPSCIADYVNECVEQLDSKQQQPPLDKVRVLVQMIEACASIIRKNNWRNCQVNLGKNFHLLSHFDDTCSSDSSIVYFMNSISLFLEVVEVKKVLSVEEQIFAIDVLAKMSDPSKDRPYQQLYLIYKVWAQMAESSDDAAIRLKQWAGSIDAHLTVGTIKNVHALESATQRDLADMSAMEKLLDFVEQGDLPSIATMCCALDLVIIQILKKPGTEQIFRLDGLRTRVKSILESLATEASDSDSRDQSARVIRFFCQYRLTLLNEIDVPPKLSREKGNVVLKSSVVNTLGLRLNEYIISELIENEIVDIKLFEMQNSLCAEARE